MAKGAFVELNFLDLPEEDLLSVDKLSSPALLLQLSANLKRSENFFFFEKLSKAADAMHTRKEAWPKKLLSIGPESGSDIKVCVKCVRMGVCACQVCMSECVKYM